MTRSLIIILLVAAVVFPALAWQSDFAVKKGYEDRYKAIAARIDSSTTLEELDSLKGEIAKLDSAYASHQTFLDKALYPTTFSESMEKLRSLHILTYDRVYLIRTQGVRLSELEARVASLTARLDTLTSQRDQLFGELQESKKSVAALREAVKRLTTNLQAKDRLIFAIVDTIFLPYGKDLNQVADVQKEAISQRLEKANVVTRVYEIAADNVKFLDVTQLQAKDYGNLIEQYQAFTSRWSGLKEKMTAVAATTSTVTSQPAGKGSTKGSGGKGGVREAAAAAENATTQAAHVDSVLLEWRAKLNAAFWSGLQKEITGTGITVDPFTDGPSFSRSIRAYVAMLKQTKQDPTTFVETLWKEKIDRDWRDGLSKESMLGKTEYASLDKLVSELSKDTIDLKLILYVLGIIVIVAAVWYFLFRKKKPAELPS